jgi:hypothetical protein
VIVTVLVKTETRKSRDTLHSKPKIPYKFFSLFRGKESKAKKCDNGISTRRQHCHSGNDTFSSEKEWDIFGIFSSLSSDKATASGPELFVCRNVRGLHFTLRTQKTEPSHGFFLLLIIKKLGY